MQNFFLIFFIFFLFLMENLRKILCDRKRSFLNHFSYKFHDRCSYSKFVEQKWIVSNRERSKSAQSMHSDDLQGCKWSGTTELRLVILIGLFRYTESLAKYLHFEWQYIHIYIHAIWRKWCLMQITNQSNWSSSTGSLVAPVHQDRRVKVILEILPVFVDVFSHSRESGQRKRENCERWKAINKNHMRHETEMSKNEVVR